MPKRFWLKRLGERPKIWTVLFCLLLLALALRGMAAEAEDSVTSDILLKNALNNLESQSIQRREGRTRSLDLLNRQDDRAAGQRLNMLKTKDPRRSSLPLLERQLDRSRRPVGSFGAR